MDCQQARQLIDQIKATKIELQTLLVAKDWQDVRSWKGRYRDDVFGFSHDEILRGRIGYAIEQLHASLFVSIKEAHEILDQEGEINVLGPEQIEQVWGKEFVPAEIPRIPFSRRELENARREKMTLLLVVNKDQNGQPMNIDRMKKISEQKQYQWFRFWTQLFVVSPSQIIKERINQSTNHENKAHWILVSKKLLPNTTKKTFFEQTLILARHFQNKILPFIRDSRIKQKFLQAINQLYNSSNKRYSNRLQMISNTIKAMIKRGGWNANNARAKLQITEILTNLEVNQLLRPDLRTTIYFIITQRAVNHDNPVLLHKDRFGNEIPQYVLTNNYINHQDSDLVGQFIALHAIDVDGVDPFLESVLKTSKYGTLLYYEH